MKYYIIAGEASGDLHASNLMKEIKLLDHDAEFRCWGGDLMKAQGAELVKHYKELAFMGFTEVLLNIRTILKNIDYCKKDIARYKPDVVILVDYPGFNLRIAHFAKENNFKVFYYISPQVWAWKQSRVHKIKQWVDKMFVIMPFEKDFYQKFNYEVNFVGHPLLDAINGVQNNADEFLKQNTLGSKPIVAVLPGSRKQEIKIMLPEMIKVKDKFPSYQFVVAAAPSVNESFYNNLIGNSGIKIVYNQTYSLLQNAKAALVTSGTATLETALIGTPEVVCYKGGAISFMVAKQLVNVKYISLVNLIMDKEVVQELIQSDFNSSNIEKELNKILIDDNYRSEMIKNYSLLKEKLGGSGASQKTATLMISYLKGPK